MTRIGVTGAQGAMGQTVRDVAATRDDVTVSLLISRDAPDIDAVQPSNLRSALDADPVDILVDFTVPSATIDFSSTAAAAGVGSVIGTTGFTDSQFEQLREMATQAPLLHAPNFSKGVHTLHAVVREAVKRMPDADIEVLETHHQRKRDAPSGTAMSLLESIESVRPGATRVHGRSGDAPRSDNEIGVHALRAGSITGEHEVLVAIEDEELRLTHRAESRRIFATGALDAAVWLADQEAGWYAFEDVLVSD